MSLIDYSKQRRTIGTKRQIKKKKSKIMRKISQEFCSWHIEKIATKSSLVIKKKIDFI